MKNCYSFLLILVSVLCSCEKDRYVYRDLCPDCISLLMINGEEWLSKPSVASFDYTPGKDTAFFISIYGEHALPGNQYDGIYLGGLPLVPGEYIMRSIHSGGSVPYAHYGVYSKGWCATPNESYYSPLEGAGTFTVWVADTISGEFHIAVDIVLYPHGLKGQAPYHPTYPDSIAISGTVTGMFSIE